MKHLSKKLYVGVATHRADLLPFFFLSYYYLISQPGGLTESYSALSILAHFGQHPVLCRWLSCRNGTSVSCRIG